MYPCRYCQGRGCIICDGQNEVRVVRQDRLAARAAILELYTEECGVPGPFMTIQGIVYGAIMWARRHDWNGDTPVPIAETGSRADYLEFDGGRHRTARADLYPWRN